MKKKFRLQYSDKNKQDVEYLVKYFIKANFYQHITQFYKDFLEKVGMSFLRLVKHPIKLRQD